MNTPSFHQPELFPASDFTQRWNNRQPRWRHPDKGGFNSQLYHVAPIPDDTTAADFIEKHHYSGTSPAMILRYGMYEKDQLVGVAVLSSPAREEVLTNPFPRLIPYKESMELGRFVLLDQVPANAETWFLARVFELARQEGVAGIVSFSDPIPRTNMAGEIIFPGHIGHIYRVKGAIYTGRSDPRTIFLRPDGRVFSERAMQKIRKQEKGHAAAEKVLLDLGAPQMEEWESPAQWLKRAMPAAGMRRLRHKGNHRYLFPLHRRIYMPLPTRPYPLQLPTR